MSIFIFVKKLTELKFKANWIYLVVIIFVAFFVMTGILIYLKWTPKEIKNNQTIHDVCLSDNETVDYTINWRQNVGPVDIIIKKQEGNKEIFRFKVDSVFSGAYPVQPRKCGVYVLRLFNYDPQKSKQSPGYKEEIWYYSYDGEGRPLLLLGIKDELGNFHDFFSLEFKVDFLEVYLALIKGYLGRIDFATVIKEIETKEDVFVFPISKIVDEYPSIVGSLGLRNWTKDNRYFWADIFMGARVLGFFRIDTTNWNVDIFEVPEDIFGGAALNIEKGYVTQYPGYVWTGVHELTEQIKQEWREQGKISSLYLYNLFAKDDILLATTSEPLWDFKDKWISDTELEYELPSGEKKVYNIEKNEH